MLCMEQMVAISARRESITEVNAAIHQNPTVWERLPSLCVLIPSCVRISSHRVEVVEEIHAVRRRGGLHRELQEGLHVQVGLDHGRGPQERRHRRSGPVYSSCAGKSTEIHQDGTQIVFLSLIRTVSVLILGGE